MLMKFAEPDEARPRRCRPESSVCCMKEDPGVVGAPWIIGMLELHFATVAYELQEFQGRSPCQFWIVRRELLWCGLSCIDQELDTEGGTLCEPCLLNKVFRTDCHAKVCLSS